nr:hypothetical protein BHM03_00039430 [Ipomoea batatas]
MAEGSYQVSSLLQKERNYLVKTSVLVTMHIAWSFNSNVLNEQVGKTVNREHLVACSKIFQFKKAVQSANDTRYLNVENPTELLPDAASDSEQAEDMKGEGVEIHLLICFPVATDATFAKVPHGQKKVFTPENMMRQSIYNEYRRSIKSQPALFCHLHPTYIRADPSEYLLAFSANFNRSVYLDSSIVKKGNERDDPQVAINLFLGPPELVNNAPPHGNQVQIAPLLATVYEKISPPQSILKLLQWLSSLRLCLCIRAVLAALTISPISAPALSPASCATVAASPRAIFCFPSWNGSESVQIKDALSGFELSCFCFCSELGQKSEDSAEKFSGIQRHCLQRRPMVVHCED